MRIVQGKTQLFFINVDNGSRNLQHAKEKVFVWKQANGDLDVCMNVGNGQAIEIYDSQSSKHLYENRPRQDLFVHVDIVDVFGNLQCEEKQEFA